MTEEHRTLGALDVSRETSSRLEGLAALLRKWGAAINLVGRSTLGDIWGRHYLDSAQLFELAPHPMHHWADLGAGAGFPGLVVAIIAAEHQPQMTVSLVESDQRKAAFLATAVRELGFKTAVYARRIEDLPSLGADVISARALAPLDKLLAMAERHASAEATCLFPKGASHMADINEALAHWRFSYQKVPSKTDAEGVVLKIGEFARV